MNDKLFASWKRHVSNLEEVLKDFSARRVISVGMTPYPRIIPASFMTRRAYGIYAVRDNRDIEALRAVTTVFSLGERNPKIAEKVQAVSFLLKNYNFQAFLKSRETPETLIFQRLSPALLSALDDLKLVWAGYDPSSCEKLIDPPQFRKLLEKFKLPHLAEKKVALSELVASDYEKLKRGYGGAFIIEPESALKKIFPILIKDRASWEELKAAIGASDAWQTVRSARLLPSVDGLHCGIVGCVTEKGVLTGGLQLALSDVPESLQGGEASGKICGYDLSQDFFPEDARSEAQIAAELVGEEICKKGYAGVFGLEFIFDPAKKRLYILSFVPGFPADSLEFSQKVLLSGAPPPDFFSFASYLKIPARFNFEAVNSAWKKPIVFSSIALSPKGLDHMTMDIQPGAYRHNSRERSAEYLGPKVFSHELGSENEYLIYDTVPRPGQAIQQDSAKLFKFFFRARIAESQNKIKPAYAEILKNFASALTGVKAQ